MASDNIFGYVPQVGIDGFVSNYPCTFSVIKNFSVIYKNNVLILLNTLVFLLLL